MSSSDVPPDFLDQPVERAVRVVALTLLRDAATTRARLIDANDTEALHDFRVAVRRLRSWLRAYRPYLDDSVRAKDRSRLRAVARATSLARDTEVHLQWLREQEPLLDLDQRAGLLHARQRLEDRKLDADEELRSEVGRDFSRVADALLDRQFWAPDDPQKHPYDDTGWSFTHLFNLKVVRVVDPAILQSKMTPCRRAQKEWT